MRAVKRNIVFTAMCLVGFGGLCANFLPRQEIDTSNIDVSGWRQLDQVVREVDREFAEDWKANSIVPASQASNLAIIRRIAFALVGTVPSLEELRAIERVPSEYQIQWYTDRLLQDRRSSDYLAERFARVFVGTEDGPFLIYRRRRFVTWLSDELNKNRPYDELVRELISSEGLWTDTPAVNFLTVTNDVNGDEQPDEERLAARTTRAFLGVRLDCVQCHDDNLDGNWLQRDFHQLAAFYSEARSSLLGISNKKDEDYEYTYLDESDSEIVDPTFPFFRDLETDGDSRRELLANWVTHADNRAFSRATVNRVWALLFGKPLVVPIDSIPLNGPFPPGLEALADEFVEQRFDMWHLIRAIVSTRAFQTDSRGQHAITDSHEAHWASFPVTRLRPEQVAGGILQACSLTTIDADSHIIVKLTRFEEQNKFVERYGDTGDDEFGGHGGTIPQRLLLLNGRLVKDKTKDDLIMNATTRIAALARDDNTAIKSAYLCVLTRLPTNVELEHFLARLEDQNRKQAIEDLYWVLLNSSEFSWNH